MTRNRSQVQIANTVLQQAYDMLGDAELYRYNTDTQAIRNWERILDTAVRLEQAMIQEML
jgi:hypothetical protein